MAPVDPDTDITLNEDPWAEEQAAPLERVEGWVEEPPTTEKRRKRFFTPKMAFGILAAVLGIVLIALLVFLLWFLGRPEVFAGSTVTQGIQPIWEVYGPGVGEYPLFSRPMGVAVGRSERIYVTDSGNNRVCVFDSQGRYVTSFGQFGVAKPAGGYKSSYRPGSLNYPVGIDTDDQGNVYVASFRNDSIEVYDPDGRPLRRFPNPQQPVGKGSSGAGGKGIAVTDVAVHGDRVYATDEYQILVFDLSGKLIDQWGRPGTDKNGLDHPNGIAVSADGETVYVSDSNHSRVTAFSTKGDVIWQVGKPTTGMSDNSPRTFDLPRGLTVLPNGSILVADTIGFKLIRLSKDGEVLGQYGSRGVEPGQINFTNDVEALRAFVALVDKETGRLQIVRLLN